MITETSSGGHDGYVTVGLKPVLCKLSGVNFAYHLASARLALRNSDRSEARTHFEKAEALIQETGYHRRDPELDQLRAELAN